MDIVIKQRQQQLKELTVAINNGALGNAICATEKVQTSQQSEANFTKMLTKIDELKEKIEQSIIDYTEKKNEIIGQIQQLEKRQYIDLLYKKYVEYKNLDTVSYEINYSYQWVKKLHSKALKAFELKFLTQ